MTTTWIAAERNSASDEELAVVSVLIGSGTAVQQGVALFEMEGAKAIFEVDAPQNGFFYSYVEEGVRVEIGTILGILSSELLDELPTSPVKAKQASTIGRGTEEEDSDVASATDAALELAQELGIDLAGIKGHDLITTDVVREFVKPNSTTSTGPSTSVSPGLNVTRVLVLGGGHGAVQLREAASTDTSIAVIGVLDDHKNSLSISGVPTLGQLTEADVDRIFSAGDADGVAIAISSRMDLRQKWREFCEDRSIPLVSIIHSGAYIAKSAQIARGALIMDSARVGAMATIETNVFVSAGVDIEHHCRVGADTTFGPGVFLSGGVEVGNQCIFGSMIAVEPGLAIGSKSIISSGAVITSDIDANSIVKVVSPLRVRKRS